MDTEPSELQRLYQRDINCLIDEDRNLRRQALTKIKSDLFKPEVDEKDLKSLFEHGLLRNLLSVVSEKVEKHREISIEILEAFFVKVKDVDPDMASNIIKETVSRMNQVPFPETSEEIRLRLVKFIRKVLSLGYLKVFTWNISDVANMTSKALSDSFPDVKKEASSLVTELAASLKESIGDYSSNIIKELVKNLNHQHSKVRKITIETLGDLLLTKNAANKLEELSVPLKNATNDKTSEVRKATFQMIARLLNGFAPSVLRNYEGQLVLALLNGLNDENSEVQDLCAGLLETVGENIKKLEDSVQEEPK